MMVSTREQLATLAEIYAEGRFEEEALRDTFVDQCLAEYDEHYNTDAQYDCEDEIEADDVSWFLCDLMDQVDYEAFTSFVRLTLTVDDPNVIEIRQEQVDEMIQKQVMEYLTEQGISVEEIRVDLSFSMVPEFKLSCGLTVTEDVLEHEEQLRSIVSLCIMNVAGEITQEEKDRRAEINEYIKEQDAILVDVLNGLTQSR
jgi:hypothetical protein